MPQLYLEELQRHLSTRIPGRHVVPRITCRDGFSMSVQASTGAYCSPRQDTGPWDEVEVGFPSRIEPLLWEYAETPGDWTNTVYPWVPVALVAALIELHGGFSDESDTT